MPKLALQKYRFAYSIACVFIILGGLCLPAKGQEQDRIERKVQNPNEAADAERKAMQRTVPTRQVNVTARMPSKPDEELLISADREEGQGNVVIYTGNVHLVYSDITLIGDRAAFNSATNDVTVEGNVFFEQMGQAVSAERLEMNLETKRGTLFRSTAYTNRTPDGTTLLIDALRADKVGDNSYVLENARMTSCQETVPKWSFTAKRARITVDDRATMAHPLFRIKNIPVFYLPYVSVSVSKKDRSSGFLLPTSGSSNIKGRTLHAAYFQTLGRSADLLVRTDIFSKRGVGLGFDFRARTDENSRISLGSFMVKDRILGPTRDALGNPLPDQGGSSFYADAVQYFKNGFVAVADVNIISNFAFRQIFAENVQQAISPEERSQLYLNKNSGAYSFNVSLNQQTFYNRDEIIKTRQLPSIEFNKRDEKISEDLPFYFSFESAFDGLKRTVTSGSNTLFSTPDMSQRFDFFPSLTFPIKSVGGFTFTPSFGFRSTFYSDSVNPTTNTVMGDNLLRTYSDFSVDIRPPSFARVFSNSDGSPKFKHIIEPYATYHLISGIDDYTRTVRFDERDAVTDTSELEYGLVNRFLVKQAGADGKSTQAREWLSLTVAQKHFFDPDFGGALTDGTRNQFTQADSLSGFAYLGFKRSYSPLNVNARLRPSNETFTDVRMDFDTVLHELRDVEVSGGLIRKMFSVSQSWYFTRRLPIGPSVYDATTLPGNQLDTSVFAGNPLKGPYLGVTMAYDFRNQFFDGTPRDPRYINLVVTGGWAWDCCGFQFQNYTFKAGLRNENRFLFSFTLKGIGTFGTDNVGQRRRRLTSP